MGARATLLATCLAASSAFAQANDWSIDRTSGTAVMDVVSPLFFTVANAATSRDAIQSFSLAIPAAPYDIDGATAPAGWEASSIDRRNRRVTFTALNACKASVGLRPGQSAVFEVRVIGVPVAADAANQNLNNNGTAVIDICNTGRTFRRRTGTSTWTLVGLASSVGTTDRSLDVGDQLSVTLTVVNDSTATQSAVAPSAVTVTGTAAFALVSGPTPALVNGLAQDGAASFTWVYRATGRGTARFGASARNTAVSSPVASSPDVNVGVFPAAVLAQPQDAVSGAAITLQVLPSNNSTSAFSNVTPLAPVVTTTGAATATLASGPTPASVGSLATSSTCAFTSTWTIRGNPGDRVTFTARASALDGTGATITSDPVSGVDVRVRELTVTPSPASVLSGAGTTVIRYTVANGSTQPISSVVLLTLDANLFRTPTATALPSGWTSTTSTNPRGIAFNANAASQLRPGQVQTFAVSYASIGTVTAPTPVSQRVHVVFADGTTARTDGTVTVAVNHPVPDVILPIAVATPGRVHLTWSNPAMHDGVLLLRASGSAPNTAPTPGVRYPAGTALGNAVVVYEDGLSFNTGVADTGLTAGVSYYYRLYNRDQYGLYSPGNVPAPSPGNALLAIPPGTGPSDALWCSTVGLPALQQPYIDFGRAVYQSSNGTFFTGSYITVGAPVNGNEKWRPSLTRGVVQARPTAMRVAGETEPSVFVGDQLGYAYRLSTTTGAITWTGNGGVALGEVVQAQAVVAPRSFASAAFQALYPVDLVFFATRNSTNRSSNSVRALRVDTGAQVFAYQPGDLDQIVGPPLFDVGSDTLWVGSLRTSGPSLRVLNVLAPAAAPLLTVSDLGDLPAGVARNGTVGQALVADRNGVARGYDLTTRALAWQVNVGGAVTNPLVPYLADFFVSTATGVQRYHIDVTAGAATPVWASAAPLRLPTSVRVDGPAGKLYVGDADGYLRRLDLATGAIEASVKASTTGGVSMPALDTTAGLKRVYVGTADGRLCVWPTTF